MNGFKPEINENFNKNYELFRRNYEISFSKLASKNLEEVAENAGAKILNRQKLLLYFFNEPIVLDIDKRKVYISSDKHTNNTFNIDNIKDFNEIRTFFDLNLKKFNQLDLFSSSIILHYLLTADGTPLSGEWILYRELPDGLFYSATIPAVLEPVAIKYGNSREKFLERIFELGGQKCKIFKFSGLLYPFKKFPILFILEEKDKEFDAGIRALFDKSASHYLKSDIIKTLLVYTVKKL